MPGSIAGSYLISEKTYGDFELTLEAHPDFPIDTGVMVHAHELGTVGYQVLVDNRPNGSIGGVYGNSVGSFLAYPFVIDADEQPGYRTANLRQGDTDALKAAGGHFRSDFAAPYDEFAKVWKPNEWNEIKIRCTGRLPLIETWINGVPVAKVDTATLEDVVPGYDAEAIFDRIGRKGHIAFEVHDSPTRERWAPGAKCRWRNVRIRELEIDDAPPKNISLTKIDGRHWLVNADGKPFFAHGITHAGTARRQYDLRKTSPRRMKRSTSTPTATGLRSSFGPTCRTWRVGTISCRSQCTAVTGRTNIATSSTPKNRPASSEALRRTARRVKNNRTASATRGLTSPLGRSIARTSRTGSSSSAGCPKTAPGQLAYQTFLESWEGDDEKARDQAFLRLIAREYFRVVGSANRKYDPDHLIFGDRLSFYTYDADVLEEMLPWIDAIAFQPHFWRGFPQKEFDEIYELSGKPILLCDWAIRFNDGDKDIRNWKQEEDSRCGGPGLHRLYDRRP